MELDEIIKRMHSGKLYLSDDESLAKLQLAALEKQYDFNQTRPSEMTKRNQLLKEMFASMGEGCYIEPPLHANWAGKFAHFGKNVYVNFNLTMVDDAPIYVGDDVMIGPNVTICTGTHPIDIELRRKKGQYNLPVYIKENVWIGGGVFIMPGVTIGENSVIGANSVVTKDIPANVVAFGSPCKVVRKISDHDKQYYYKDRKVDV